MSSSNPLDMQPQRGARHSVDLPAVTHPVACENAQGIPRKRTPLTSRSAPTTQCSLLQAVTLPRRTRKSQLRRLSEPASVKPGAAQILIGISLVTFFVPAKKV